MKEFKIDLSKPEFSTQLEESELWQQAAWDNLFNMLDKSIAGAKAYTQQRNVKPDECAAYHNAIYIYGGRGSGKTVFLKNMKRRWEKETDNKTKLHITDAIDPTLLLNHDSFAIVVVAQIYNEIENHFKTNVIPDEIKQKFYKSLKALADGIAQKGELSDYVGIDRIIKYRSGVQVENLFHKFIESACQTLGTAAIAVPIDDVDMALTKAFDVLDVVRRLLSCPLIVPIVSGDTNLYQKIIELHFKKELQDVSGGLELADELNLAYLTKIFPNQYRIGLVNVNEILPYLIIKDLETLRSYKEYKAELLNRFYYLTNGEERSNDWPEPSTPREVQQLLSTILLKQSNNTPSSGEWVAFKQWAEQKQHGIGFTNACSELVASATSLEEFDINNLMSFSPLLQKNINLSWAPKEYLIEQLDAIKRLASESDKKGNKKLIDAALGNEFKVLRSMPSLELHTNKMTVPGRDGKKDSMLVALYTHRDYYTTMANTTAKVFFSRAFELLVASLIKPVLASQEQWEDYLKALLKRAPFYCIHAISPTKYMSDGNSENLEEDLDSKDNVELAKTISAIAEKMVQWQVNNRDLLLDLNSKPSLLPLLHNVFNKVFSLLQLFKENTKIPVQGETLHDSILRFEYITVNAFSTFLVQNDVVVKANTAQTENLDTLRDYGAFKGSDRVFTRNVTQLLDLDTKKALDDRGGSAKLLEAIWSHPIFDLQIEDGAEYFLDKVSVKEAGGNIANATVSVRRVFSKSKAYSDLNTEVGGVSPKKISLWAKNNTNKIDKYIDDISADVVSGVINKTSRVNNVLIALAESK